MSEQFRARINDLKKAGYSDAKIGKLLGKSGSSVGRFRRGETKNITVDAKARAKVNRLFTGKTKTAKKIQSKTRQVDGLTRKINAKIAQLEAEKQEAIDDGSPALASDIQDKIDALNDLKNEDADKLKQRLARAKTEQDWERFKAGYQNYQEQVASIEVGANIGGGTP